VVKSTNADEISSGVNLVTAGGKPERADRVAAKEQTRFSAISHFLRVGVQERGCIVRYVQEFAVVRPVGRIGVVEAELS
jgi:hypothetical protein